MIPSSWEAERVYARDAVVQTDLDSLQKLWEDTAYIGQFDGHPERESDDMLKNLTEGPELPPDGSKEFARIQPIFSKQTEEMIGYLTMYHGYPNKETVWIAFFGIHTREQARGYGQEIINQLDVEAKSAGYHRLMLVVALKNWAAIRFWTKIGFDKIALYYGDKEYGDKAFANLALEKSLV